MVTENISIDVRPGGVPVVIHVTQYEVGLREFVFTPYTSGGTLTAVAGSATLEGTKPDGYAFQQACEMVDGVITYTLQEQLCAVEGRVWSRLVIRDTDGGMIGYTAIVWVVGRAGVIDDAVMSDSDISALRQFFDEFGTIDAYRGALEQAVSEVQAQSTQLAAEINARTNADAVLTARMDTFASLPDGSVSTTADAELVDIRVKANGGTASTAGDAVRQQVVGIVNDLKNGEVQTFGSAIRGFYPTASGFSASGSAVTAVFPVENLKTYYVSWLTGSNKYRVAFGDTPPEQIGAGVTVYGYIDAASLSHDHLEVTNSENHPYMYVYIGNASATTIDSVAVTQKIPSWIDEYMAEENDLW